jgi:betaine reductase
MPTVIITALPSIAAASGANRILRGVSITTPVGDPSLTAREERDLRHRLFRRALEMLASDVAPGTVWEVAG